MDPAPDAEEIIGSERVPLRQSAVKSIKLSVILEAKLSVGAEKSFLISLTKTLLSALSQCRPSSFPAPMIKEYSKDILAVEGVNEAAVKTDNAPRRPAHFVLHTFRWKDEKKDKRKYAKLLIICANPVEKDRWVSRVELLLRAHPDSMHNKRFKVLVNPFSGSKNATKIWQDCEMLFKMSGIRYDVTNTAYARHAKEIASQIDLRQYHAIITVSGDGLLFEVVNGLMERADWQRALSLLLGAIPAGSGNGLAKSVGSVDPVTATFEMLKGKRRKMDLMHVVQDKSSCYAFLSVTWALIADIDLESEGMRWMGDTRFTVAALGLVASPRTYKGRLYWLPHKPTEGPPIEPKPADNNAHVPAATSQAPAAAVGSPAATDAPAESAASPLALSLMSSASSIFGTDLPTSPRDPSATESIASLPPAAAQGQPSPSVPQVPTPAPLAKEPSVPSIIPAAVSALALSAASILSPTPPAELPAPVALAPGELLTPEGRLRDAFLEAGVSVERGWIAQEKPWSIFIASNVTHLSSTTYAAPKHKWGEGCLDLIVSTSAERTDMLSFLLNLEDGSWVTKATAVEYHKVRAFVIEPQCKEGIFSLDGERTEYTPLRCELHPSLLNILG